MTVSLCNNISCIKRCIYDALTRNSLCIAHMQYSECRRKKKGDSNRIYAIFCTCAVGGGHHVTAQESLIATALCIHSVDDDDDAEENDAAAAAVAASDVVTQCRQRRDAVLVPTFRLSTGSVGCLWQLCGGLQMIIRSAGVTARPL